MHVCIHMCIHMRMHIYVCVRMCVCTCVYMQLCVYHISILYTYVYMCMCNIHICVCVHIYTRITRTFARAYMCIYMIIYAHYVVCNYHVCFIVIIRRIWVYNTFFPRPCVNKKNIYTWNPKEPCFEGFDPSRIGTKHHYLSRNL